MYKNCAHGKIRWQTGTSLRETKIYQVMHAFDWIHRTDSSAFLYAV